VVVVATLALATVGYAVYDTHQKLYELSLARQYEHDHDFGRAREHYLRAVAAGVGGADVYNGLAWVSAESGTADPREALKYAEMAFALQPGNPDVLDTYGWALHHAGRPEEALPRLQEAFRMRPEMYCIHYHLGAVYESLGQIAPARDHYRRQLALAGTREARMAAQALARLDDAPR
jgi:Tfp pilus assembly protein PilF